MGLFVAIILGILVVESTNKKFKTSKKAEKIIQQNINKSVKKKRTCICN